MPLAIYEATRYLPSPTRFPNNTQRHSHRAVATIGKSHKRKSNYADELHSSLHTHTYVYTRMKKYALSEQQLRYEFH